MSFGSSGQVLVSRSYFEVVTRISEDYSQMFAYQGSRTDKHVREHEIYAVAVVGTDALDVATRRHRARPRTRPALKLVDTTLADAQAPPTWLRRIRLPYALAALSCLALMLAIVYFVSDRAANRASGAVRFGPAIRLADPAVPPSKESPTRTAASTQSGASEAQSSRSVAKKSALAHKVGGAAHTASEVPAAVPVAVKAPAAEPPSPAAAAPWRPYNDEHKAAPGVSASGANIGAASPYTAAAPKAATALVMLAVSPWGEVIVDGKSVGVSPPLSELELTPGTHQVEIRNGDFTPHLVTLQLDSNQTIRIKHKFKQR
jgi:hypothetical protein